MDTFSKIIAVLFAAMMLFFLYRFVRSNPESLSRENLSKSFGAMGILGIVLIVFVAGVIMLLRAN